MTYSILPSTEDPWQVFTLDLTIDDEPFHAQIEIRYLSAPDQWVLSIWDHAAGVFPIHGGNQRSLGSREKGTASLALTPQGVV